MTAKARVFLQSTVNPALKFPVLKYDPATQTATLEGRWKATFTVCPFTKEHVQKDGYTLITEAL